MYVLRFGAADLARVRFAVSPLWEAMAAVRALVDPRTRTHHLPWLEAVRPLLADLDLMPLLTLQPRRGYTPDFPTPAPSRPLPDVRDQLAQVRATPLDQVRAEVRRALADRDGEPVPSGAEDLANDPGRTRARVATALESVWDTLVAPHWPQLKELLRADIAYHGRLLAERGLEHVLPVLHPAIRWTGEAVIIAKGHDQQRRLAGAGLLLQPSAFAWPALAVVVDEPHPPALVYPARGVAELWQPVTSDATVALARLLGRTRATLLTSLREPASTATLARRHGLAAATVSQHLTTLRAAGLVTSHRHRHCVLYESTELGDGLMNGGFAAWCGDRTDRTSLRREVHPGRGCVDHGGVIARRR